MVWAVETKHMDKKKPDVILVFLFSFSLLLFYNPLSPVYKTP